MKELIDKYLNDTIDNEEVEKLMIWLEKENNQKKFKTIVENHYYLNLGIQEVDLEKEYTLLINTLADKHISTKRPFYINYRGAAVLIALFGLGYLLYITAIKSNKLEIQENAITIVNEHGDIQVIKENGTVAIVNNQGKVIGRQNKNQLDYKNVETEDNRSQVNENLAYNELVVPYGKKMKLILSDSTIVHINAGTRFKYPVKFLKNQDRKVYLNGEAFFEVYKSKSHPFIVNADKIDVRVLGTKFNVSAYENDNNVSAVLVEGAVELLAPNKQEAVKYKHELTPGYMASWNKAISDMNITKVDVNEYTSWINGQIIFKIRPFSEILKVLERHYNVTITNNYKLLNSQHFFAKIDTETIDQVMIYFQSSTPFTYTRVGNKIEINQP